MSPSPETQKRKLSISGYPTLEISVLDGNLETVAHGVGELSAELSPGIYRIRFSMGDRLVDNIEEVPAGEGPVFLQPPKLEIPSPIPWAELSPAIAANLADTWSTEISGSSGKGGQLFIFLNGSENPSDDSGQLSVHRFDGEEIASQKDFRVAQQFKGANLELDPGSYLLRVESPVATIEQSVYIASRWQTQVFIPISAIPTESGPRYTADLSGSATLMTSLGSGFRPNNYSVRSVEAARHALASGQASAAPVKTLTSENTLIQQVRHGLDDEQLGEMLRQKWVDPMLGIYGAHLLAMQSESDKGLLHEVVDNLLRLVGPHPDVEALLFEVSPERAQNISFPIPPSLRSSWNFIVRNSANPSVVPAGSCSSRIGASLWGSGSSLCWKAPQSETPVQGKITAVDWDSLLKNAPNIANPAALQELSPAESVVLNYITGTAARVQSARSLSAEIDKQKTFGNLIRFVRPIMPSELEKEAKLSVSELLKPEQISSYTGLPCTSIEDAASSLTTKLRRSSSSRSTPFLSSLLDKFKR